VTKATVDGRPILASSPFVWSLRPGTQPVTAVADFAPSDVDALLGGALRPLRLEIDDGHAIPIRIDGVYAIQEAPPPNPQVRRVLLADRRWFWNRKHIRAVYNLRRHIGVKRLKGPAGPLVTMPIVDDVQYAPFSLRNGVPWKASDAIKDVLGQLSEFEGREAGSTFAVSVVDASQLDEVPFENLILDDTGDQALARLLAYLPEWQVAIDPSGDVRTYSRAGGTERKQLEDFGAEKITGGHIAVLSLDRVRPKEIHVLFTPESEIRFDFEEEADITRRDGGEARMVDNVLPVPDAELPVEGMTVAQGTWITVDQALAAWGSLPVIGPLSQERLRRLAIPYTDLWSPTRLAGEAVPDADWSARLSALAAHWRRTFRINRRWMDRIQRLNAYRVATMDQETGTRAPAQAWSDWFAMGSMRSMFLDVDLRQGDAPYGVNAAGYPAGGKLAGSRAAPCRVTILDHDEGIVRLDWLSDPVRIAETVLPGTVENVPRENVDHDVLAFNSIADSAGPHNMPRFAAGYKAIVLLSAVPAVPNDARQLHRVKVRPGDVQYSLPPGVDASRSGGPIMEVRVLPSLETARVAWDDGRAQDIETLFGVREGEPNLAGLLVNENPGRQAQAGSLDEIAKAIAARIWAGFADRAQGQARFGTFVGPVQGMIDQMDVEVASSGEVTATVEVGRQPLRLNAFSLMPRDVRAFVLKLAQPGK
jgi:hypothetical protein